MCKIIHFFFLLCLVASSVNAERDDPFRSSELTNENTAKSRERNKKVRGCENWGFFAEFLWVLNHLQWCEETKKVPVIYWDQKFAYYSQNGYNGSKNAWEYYFEPVSELKYKPEDHIYRDQIYTNFSTIWWYGQYIKNLHLLTPEEQQSIKGIPLRGNLASGDPYPAPEHLYSTKFRAYVKTLIDKYIRVKSNIQAKIDGFYDSNMRGNKVVGLHFRGGFVWNEVNIVPLELICEEANKHADESTVFFVATDQYPLLERAKELLNGKVVYYDCYRQASTTSPVRSGQWPPQMGEDVLVETILLSHCDYLVHTISNVSTAALYFNPTLPHTMLYCSQLAP